MTDRLTYDQRYNAITAIAAHRTERKQAAIDWEYATLLSAATTLGLTDDELDALFVQAATL